MSAAPHDPTAAPSLTRWLIITALAALALRLWIAAALPITGDEAFFYWWGVYPDWGYYDHPPMVGWLIWLMRHLFGEAAWAIRLPVVLLPLALGGLLWWAFKPLDRERAAWGVLLFWLAPINWLNTLITTDTPLIFWSVLSVALLLRAERRAELDRHSALLYALSGLALGCAFLSKYFSVVLGLAYLVYFALYRRERWPGLVLLVLCALPGPAINLWWNMGHGWANIMFNAINRNQDAQFELRKPLTYLAMLAYLLTPAVLWLGAKHWRVLMETARQQRLVATLVVVPLLFFTLLSGKKVVGLHWVLAFYPFVFVLLAFALPRVTLRRCAQGLAAFTVLHAVGVLAIAFTDLDQWQDKPRYYSFVRSFRTAELLAQVRTPDTVLMADGYAPAAAYGYTIGRYVPVFGSGKFHARQDDLLVDYADYEGRNVRILVSDGEAPPLDGYRPYFDS
ncbi:MAG: glycosyltransferase family 39 protein, partial [Hylemonella sp.]|nr:glycosyltransferase family 39 protein [Hylemonella sp.]